MNIGNVVCILVCGGNSEIYMQFAVSLAIKKVISSNSTKIGYRISCRLSRNGSTQQSKGKTITWMQEHPILQ